MDLPLVGHRELCRAMRSARTPATVSCAMHAQRMCGCRAREPPLCGVGHAKPGQFGFVAGPNQATCTVRMGLQCGFGPFAV
jgi:hypothetical protein